jgi:hypothetical protein
MERIDLLNTIKGSMFHIKPLAGPLEPEVN